MWTDDIKNCTKFDNHEKIKRAAEDTLKWRMVAGQTSVREQIA